MTLEPMAKQKTRVTQGRAINAIYRNKGILAKAARELDVTRRTLYNYMERWPKVREAYEDASDETLDLAEQGLFDAIRAGSLSAIMFVLKTKGRSRGYVERTEMKQIDELEITVKREDSDG